MTETTEKVNNMTKNMELKKKVYGRLDELEAMMKAQEHLHNPTKVVNHIATITKFWSVLEEQDREYIDGCRFAIESNLTWDQK